MSRIGRNVVGLFLDQAVPTTFDEFGRDSPVAACPAPRPGKTERDEDTPSRPTTGRWCLCV